MKKTRTVVVPVITTLAEANALLREVGATARTITDIELVLESQIAKLREDANKQIAPLALAQKQKLTQLELYAESNRGTLFPDKKRITLPAGEIGWRFTPPKVTFGKGGAKKVLELLRSLKLSKYIRTTYEVDREALLRDKPVVKGVKYASDELFYANPCAGDEPDVYPGTRAQQIL